ncbi:MAG TPA: type I polyketide synthase [Thermoanaerobaculia bacterium]|nr:type I polyketide synthase [Thermoanaerobaculia bacterium]
MTATDAPVPANAIAIIGMAGRFPGAPDVRRFWQRLRDGDDCITSFTDAELTRAGVPPEVLADPHYVKAAPVLDDVEGFDAALFEYSPKEARLMDPQQRLFLECCWQALEDAAYDPARFPGAIGVFGGAGGEISSYLLAFAPAFVGALGETGGFEHLGNDKDFLATRVSFKLGLRGPSLTVQTACSTSLVAVHLACQSLLCGECEMALAGGTTVRVPHRVGYRHHEGGIFSPDGRCRSFDAGAAGTLFGSGAGVVLLRPLEAALAAGDPIHAVIRGSSINNDGAAKVSYTASSLDGQAAAIAEAYAVAGIDPASIGFVEAHGTATHLGDPLEVGALTRVFRQSTDGRQFCALGSVKSNVGHLEAAAGVAGLIKAALALAHGEVPPSLHFAHANPRIDFASSPFFVNTAAIAWPDLPGPRRAAVNSLGIGGTNAHLVLEEAPAAALRPGASLQRSHHLLVLTARTRTSLRALAGEHADFLRERPGTVLADAGWTHAAGRRRFDERLAVVAATAAEAADRLAAFAQAGEAPGVVAGSAPRGAAPKVAFLFSGQGSQHAGMGRELYESEPVFRAALDRCASLLEPWLDRPLLEGVLFAASEVSHIDRTVNTQPALFALEHGLAELWRSWGVVPGAVIGHSLGEVVAATEAGVLQLADGLALAARRGRLMEELPGEGAMTALLAGEAAARELMAPFAGEVAIAALNGPDNTVISGWAPAVQAVAVRAAERGIQVRPLTVSHAFHSPQMDPMLEALEAAARGLASAAPRLPLISNLTGTWATGDELCQAGYWSRHARHPVRFAHGLETLYAQGFRVFVEIGPHPVLCGMGRRILPEADTLWLPSLRNGRPAWAQIAESAGALSLAGVELDWQAFYRGAERRRLSLPAYAFDRERHWLGDDLAAGHRAERLHRESAQHPLLGRRLASPRAAAVFDGTFAVDEPRILRDHVVQDLVVVSGPTEMSMALDAGRHLGSGPVTLEDVTIREALILVPDEPRRVQVAVEPDGPGSGSFEIFSARDEEAGETGAWRLHVTGRVRVGERTPGGRTLGPAELEAIRGRCREEISGERFYADFAPRAGFYFGPTYQCIERLWVREAEILCELRALPPAVDPERDLLGAYQLYPGMLDSCFQLFVVAIYGSREPIRESFVPFNVQRLTLHALPETETLWAHAVRLGEGGDPEALLSELRLYDANGRLLVEGSGLRFKRATPEALQRVRAAQEGTSGWIYDLVFRPVAELAAAEPTAGAAGEAWLLLADRGGIAEALAGHLRAAGASVVCALPGDGFASPRPGWFAIDPRSRRDFDRVLGELAAGGPARPRRLVHLWGLDGLDHDQAAIEASLETACGGLLKLVQALSAGARGGPPSRLAVVTRGAQHAGGGDDRPSLAQAPLWGLVRALAQEKPELAPALIDLPPARAGDDAARLFAELAAGGEPEVALRAGGRLAPRIAPRKPSRNLPPLTLRPDAAYLITGGLGGLGLEIARWLAAQGVRHLTLVGRREGSAAALAQVEQLAASGVEVTLAQADVADEAQVREVLGSLAGRGLTLAGVVHAAGVIADGVLQQQTWASFQSALRPKVGGTLVLDRLTADLDLDFFVVFSSAAALLGSPGQGNYAAANGFLDAWAQRRHAAGRKALSIAWGPWSQVGLAASVAQRGQQRWTTGAFGAIAPAQGAKLFGELLRAGTPWAAVLPLRWQQYLEQFAFGGAPALLREMAPEARAASAAGPEAGQPQLAARLAGAAAEDRPALLAEHLRGLLAEVLGLPPGTPIEPRRGFTTMGLDSLMAIDLRNRLERDLGPRHTLPSTLVFDYPNLQDLDAHLAAEVLGLTAAAAAAAGGDRAAEDRARLEREIASLSDEEAEQLLREELASLGGTRDG